MEPEEIRLAVKWLELNRPEEPLGLAEVLWRAQCVQELAEKAEALRGVGRRCVRPGGGQGWPLYSGRSSTSKSQAQRDLERKCAESFGH